MKFQFTSLFALAATALALSFDDEDLNARHALADLDDLDDILWAREANEEMTSWMEDLLEARDAELEDSASVDVQLFLSREADPKKQAKSDGWVAPIVNIAPGTKVTKNTFKCNTKKHTCSGEIDVAS